MTEEKNRSGPAVVIADCVQTDALLGSPLKPTRQRRSDFVRRVGLCREDDQEQAHREVSEIITGIVSDEPLMTQASLPLMPFHLPNVAFVLSAAQAPPLVGKLVRFRSGCV